MNRAFRSIADMSREVVDTSIRLLPIIRTNHNHKKKRLLIIRLDGIGDAILFLDVFKEYHKIFPSDEWEITLLGNSLWEALVKDLPYADSYWFIDVKHLKRNPVYRYRVIRRVRDARFDVVIQPAYSRSYWLGDTIVRASRAPERIGSECDLINITDRQKQRSDRWYTALIPSGNSNVMELERNAGFLRGLGLDDFRTGVPRLPIPVGARASAVAILKEAGLCRSTASSFGDFYVLFPGAGSRLRQWPVKHFAALARQIHDRYGWHGVICGASGDKSLAEQVCALAVNIPLVDLSGRTNLTELAWVIRFSKLLIGSETGAIHIASAVDTSSICILGGGHFGRFVPYNIPNNIQAVYEKMDCFGCNWRCIHKIGKAEPAPCIEQIKLGRIIESLTKMV